MSLDGELCLGDGKNAAFLYKFTISGRHGKRHSMTMSVRKPLAVSDWLNPHSLGSMSALGYIENLV